MLSSTSTLVEVKAAYDDNASYAEDGSVAKAKAFETACRILLRRTPERAAHGGSEELQFDLAQIQAELKRVVQFISRQPTSAGGSVRFFGFGSFR